MRTSEVYTLHVLIRDCNRFCYKIGGGGGGGRGIVWNSKGLKHFAVFVQRPGYSVTMQQ